MELKDYIAKVIEDLAAAKVKSAALDIGIVGDFAGRDNKGAVQYRTRVAGDSLNRVKFTINIGADE